MSADCLSSISHECFGCEQVIGLLPVSHPLSPSTWHSCHSLAALFPSTPSDPAFLCSLRSLTGSFSKDESQLTAGQRTLDWSVKDSLLSLERPGSQPAWLGHAHPSDSVLEHFCQQASCLPLFGCHPCCTEPQRTQSTRLMSICSSRF